MNCINNYRYIPKQGGHGSITHTRLNKTTFINGRFVQSSHDLPPGGISHEASSSQLVAINFILVQCAQEMSEQLDVVELIRKSSFTNEG